MKKYNKLLIIINFLFIFFWLTFFVSFDFNKDINLKNEIKRIYQNYLKVNINNIDEQMNNRKYLFQKVNTTINIGFTLDVNFTLQTMITVASIIATKKKTTKIRFHFGVTDNFTVENMLKIYSLRNKINNLTEFNFYYLRESVEKMKKFHHKGEACPGKFELPNLLPDDVNRLLIFDAGDLLVFRDLSELYNYDMKQYWALANPEPTIIESFMKTTYNISKYLNIGALLLDVNKMKYINFWGKYVKNRYLLLRGQPDQTLFNILVPDNEKNYFPFRFGGYTLFRSDKNYESLIYEDYKFKEWFNSSLSYSLPENPKSEEGILKHLYNPVFIHQFYGKWQNGNGLSIYRILVKYFIFLTGFQNEICKLKPGYCK